MKSQSSDIVATEKRILMPSGRLQQVAALVYRHDDAGQLQILIITSRGSGRWIIPKGWPQVGRTLGQTALREAYEEAGIRGNITGLPVGEYDYEKTDLPPESISDFSVVVYAVAFDHQEKNWPERGERVLEWVSPEDAAKRVDENDLKRILLRFGPSDSVAAE